MHETQHLYNLLCCDSGEYEKQFSGDGDSSRDRATVWREQLKRGRRSCRFVVPQPLLHHCSFWMLSLIYPPCSECLPVPLPCWPNLTLAPHLHRRPLTSYTRGKPKKQQGELETLFQGSFAVFEKPLPAGVCD